MKKAKKVLALFLAAVMLVCTTVAATVAYLTSRDAVTNTFTVGKVLIELDETDTDGDQTAVTNNTAAGRDKANEYKIFPGGTYDKDPIVHVLTGSEDCYVFVKVVNNLGESEVAVAELGTIEAQMLANKWAKVEGVANVWIYKGNADEKEIVNAEDDLTVFTKFAVSNTLTNDTLADLEDKTIVVNAYAVQADGFANKTPAEIWDAAKF